MKEKLLQMNLDFLFPIGAIGFMMSLFSGITFLPIGVMDKYIMAGCIILGVFLSMMWNKLLIGFMYTYFFMTVIIVPIGLYNVMFITPYIQILWVNYIAGGIALVLWLLCVFVVAVNLYQILENKHAND